jgi:hypothetical protein
MVVANIAFCGIDCGVCPAFIATQANNPDKLAEVAQGWTSDALPLRPDDVACEGCHADRVAKFVTECPTRQCGLEKGVGYCAECGEYVCGKLEKQWGMLGEEIRTSSKATLDKLSLNY